MVLCPYWANIRRWIPTGFIASAQRNRTTPRCSSMVQSCKEGSMFCPRCCHSTDGALYCTWLNTSTIIVYTTQCASYSLSRLPRNLKIAFTFWFTLACMYIYIYIGKIVPLQAWSGPESSRKLRVPDFMKTAHVGGKVVRMTHWSPFSPRKYSWYSFLLEAESTPGP